MLRGNERLWESWSRALKARNRSSRTLQTYYTALRLLDRHFRTDLTRLKKTDLEIFFARRLGEVSATTVVISYRSIRAFYNWLAQEEYLPKSPMAGMHEPAVEDVPPPVLPDDALKLLLKTCSAKTFENRRDEAIIRVFCESGGPRLGEITGMSVECLDLTYDLFKVTGKGMKTRLIPFGAKTGVALDRYLRLREHHRLSALDALWIGKKGKLTGSAISQLIAKRSLAAGLGRVHPHQLRHTSAHRWFESGGSEQDAMLLFGWASPDMPRRYGRSAGISRAHNASRRISLGDRL